MTVIKKVCPKCGDTFSTSIQYCPECNVLLKSEEVEDTAYIKKEYCPYCKNEIKSGTRNCPHCGELIAKGTTKVLEHYSYNSDSNNSGDNNVFLYVVSFLIPLVGFIAGGILLTSDDYYKKSSGKTCLILGVISIIISSITLFAITR